jgi:hypothetical protein
VQTSATGPRYDMQVNNLGTVQYIEVKWSRNGITAATARDVAQQASLYPPGTFLLEANAIGPTGYAALVRHGGRKWEDSYPH